MKRLRYYAAIFICAFLVSYLANAGCGRKGASDNSAKGRTASGLKYMAENKFDEAIKEFKSAIAANPKDPKAYNALGLALEREGLFEEAKKAFHDALRIDKKYEEAKANLANMEEVRREYGFYRFAMDFIHGLSKEYSNGNNSFLRGVNRTKEVRDESGRIVRYDINYEIYLAKEYFDKCSKIIEEIADRAAPKAPSDLIDIIATAIGERNEAIDLQIQGYAMERSYSGEFEKARAKVKIADTYYLDAAARLEAMMREKRGPFSGKDFDDIKYLISYYSQDKTAEIEGIK